MREKIIYVAETNKKINLSVTTSVKITFLNL